MIQKTIRIVALCLVFGLINGSPIPRKSTEQILKNLEKIYEKLQTELSLLEIEDLREVQKIAEYNAHTFGLDPPGGLHIIIGKLMAHHSVSTDDTDGFVEEHITKPCNKVLEAGGDDWNDVMKADLEEVREGSSKDLFQWLLINGVCEDLYQAREYQ